MKEKVKGNPRRRLFWLAGLLVLLLGGYFSLPFAQTAFINWWEDDPFTPMCDVPHLELVYTKSEDGIQRLYRWHQGIQPERFTELEANNFWTLQWSPDYHILYIEKENASFLVSDINPILVRPLEAYIRLWEWSPNNEYAAVVEAVAGESHLHIHNNQNNADYNNSYNPIIAEGKQIRSVSWSPDSQRVAFMSDGQLKVMQADEGDWQEIFSVDRYDTAPPLWSPDSNFIAQGDIFIDVFNVMSQEQIWRIEMTSAWDWGERGILLLRSTNDTFLSPGEPSYEDIFIANIDAQTIDWVADGNHSSITGWSASEEAFLFSPELVSFSVLHFMDDGKEYVFDNLMWPQFTPDGRYVSYQKENGWLYLFDMESRNPCRLFEEIPRETYRSAWRIIPNPSPSS